MQLWFAASVCSSSLSPSLAPGVEDGVEHALVEEGVAHPLGDDDVHLGHGELDVLQLAVDERDGPVELVVLDDLRRPSGRAHGAAEAGGARDGRRGHLGEPIASADGPHGPRGCRVVVGAEVGVRVRWREGR